VEVCRQSRLRGRIHARPSASGLAVLCPASSYFISYVPLPPSRPPSVPPLSLSLSCVPRVLSPPAVPRSTAPLSDALSAGSGPRTPSGGPLRLARHRRVARVPVLRAPHYLQFARYRAQVRASSVHPRSRSRDHEHAAWFPDSGLIRHDSDAY